MVASVAAYTLIDRFNHDGAPPTLAIQVLPFTAVSSDPEMRQLASATHDAVAHTLSHSAFAITVAEPGQQGAPPAADFVISGELSGTPEKVISTVRMDETAHHFVVFSHQFESSRKAVSDFPELIGAQVASQLSWTAPLIAIERRHPSDPAITASIFGSSSAGLESLGPLHDYEVSRRLAAKAPNSPLAQNSLAFNTAFALDQIPREERGKAVAEARRAADRAITLAPEFGGAYISSCLLHSEQRRIECEDHLRAGMRAAPDSAFVGAFLSMLLNDVGRITEAAELASLSLAHDQYMSTKIARTLLTLESTGETEKADALYRRTADWWPHDEAIFENRRAGMAERGDFEAVQRFEREAGGADQPTQESIAAVASAVKAHSVRAGREACARPADDFTKVLCMLALARLGDLDASFALADQLYPSRRGRTPAEEERIWLGEPYFMSSAFVAARAAAPLRRDPRYLVLAQRVGLLEYWRSGRLPDFCQPPHPEPICAQLRAR